MTWIKENIGEVSQEAHEKMCKEIFGIAPTNSNNQNQDKSHKG